MRKIYLLFALMLFGLLTAYRPIYAQTTGDDFSRDLMRSIFIETINNMEPHVVRGFFFYVTENAPLVAPEQIREVREYVNQTGDESIHSVVIETLSRLLAGTADSTIKQAEGYWGFAILANMFVSGVF
jgi:hypothetical protein